jgi:hypothetical protein
MSAGGLTPAWQNDVPPMFRSHAASIESHRIRLVGDSGALRRLSSQWRSEAAAVDAAMNLELQARAQAKQGWYGEAAEAFDRMCEQLAGELSGNGTGLKFAADGLDLAADVLDRTRQAGDAACVQYVTRLRQMYQVYLAAPPAAQQAAMARLISEGTALGQRTLQAVYAQTVELDAFLASMPRRFQLGKEMRPGEFAGKNLAPYREFLGSPLDDLGISGFEAGGTAFSVKVVRREGMMVFQMADGTVRVALDDRWTGAGVLAAGTKLNVGHLPTSVQKLLNRSIAGEAGVVGGYQQIYQFSDQAAADAFIDRVENKSWIEKAAGFVGGPIADFNPWHSDSVGQAPAERAFYFNLNATGEAELGAGNLLTARGGGQGATGLMYFDKGDNGSALMLQTVGSGNFSAEAGPAKGTAALGQMQNVIVEYNHHGDPTKYTVQTITEQTLQGNVGLPKGTLPDGFAVGQEDAYVQRTVHSQSLNLEIPENRAAFQEAQSRDLNSPVPPATGALQDRLVNNGWETDEHYQVERNRTAVEGQVGGGVTFGLQGAHDNETVTRIDGVYRDSQRTDSLYPSDPSPDRPIPRDPRPVAP